MALGERWTEDEDAVLTAAHTEGRTDREIAAILAQRRSRAWTFAPVARPLDPTEPQDGMNASDDRTEKAVTRRRQQLGLVRPAAPLIDRERLRALHAAGTPTADMATALGATHRTVQELCSRMRLPLPGRWGGRRG